MSGTESEIKPPMENRFCPMCGESLIPLVHTIHVSRTCNECGKTIYQAKPGEGGKGIKISEGDKVTIPAGVIKLSLNPKDGGKFYRVGLLGFIDTLLTSGLPNSPDELEKSLDNYEKEGLEFLSRSEIMKDLDVFSQKDSDEAWKRISEHKGSIEHAAALTTYFVGYGKEALKNNEPVKASWALFNAAAYHSLFVVKEENFQKILWEGYKAHEFLSRVDDAKAQTPAEADALHKLKTLFEKQDEATLHTWVEDGRPIGPRINISGIPEETLRVTAKHYLSLIERKREDSRKNTELLIKFVSLGVGAGGLILAALKALGMI